MMITCCKFNQEYNLLTDRQKCRSYSSMHLSLCNKTYITPTRHNFAYDGKIIFKYRSPDQVSCLATINNRKILKTNNILIYRVVIKD